MRTRLVPAAPALLSVFLLSACGGRGERPDAKAHVDREWSRIAAMAEKGAAMRDESKGLPYVSLFSKSRRSQNKAIARHLEEGRRLLMPTNAKEIFASVEKYGNDIASSTRELEKVRADIRAGHKKERKAAKKARKIEKRIAAMEKARAAELVKAAALVRAAGLDIDDASMDVFLSNAGANDLVDGALVAGGIRAAVDQLQTRIDGADIESARRYFGMYIVLVDIQLACFDDFIDDSDHVWIAGVDKILKEAGAARSTAAKNAKADGFTDAQREVFFENIRSNSALIDAARAYRDMLVSQRDAVARKRDATLKIRATAQNSYDTVRIAGDFAEFVRSGGRSFDAVMAMELPPLAVPKDLALVAEFKRIGNRLREGR